MKRFSTALIYDALLTLFTFLASAIFFGFVTDDYAYFMGALAAKQFSDFAYFDVYFQGFIGIREIYRLLYQLLPSLNWHFLFSLAYELVTLFLAMRLISTVLLRNISFQVTLVVKMLFCIIYLENIFMVSHTRVSILLCGIALIQMSFRNSLLNRQSITYALVFLFGMLLRPESGLGTISLTGFAHLVYYMQPLKTLERLWLPISFVMIFMAIFYIDLLQTDVFVKKIEPEVEYKIMAERVVDMSLMKTAKDSVKYEAALIGMWFDTKEMNPNYLRSLIKEGTDTSYEHNLKVAKHVISLYSEYPLITLTLLLAVLLPFATMQFPFPAAAKVLILIIATFALFYAIDFPCVYLLSNRHFISLQLISLFIIVFYLFNEEYIKLENAPASLWVAILLVLVTGAGLSIRNYVNESTVMHAQIEATKTCMTAIDKNYNKQLIATTNEGRVLFDRPYSIFNQNYTNNTYIMFDWFTFGLTPRYVDYVSRLCNCNAYNPTEVFTWMANNKVMYLSTPYKFDLTERYMNTIHNLPLKFTEPVQVNTLGNTNDHNTKECQLRKVTLAP